MSTIVVKDWYQIDFKMKSPAVDLKKIDRVMKGLVKEGLVSKWFFLLEQGPVIRIRMESPNKDELHKKLDELSSSCGLEPAESLPFSEYAEGSESLFNEEAIKSFVVKSSSCGFLTRVAH